MSAATRPGDLQLICGQGNITVEDLDNSEKKVSLETNCALMEAAATVSGDEHLGLHMGEKITPAILGITGHLLQTDKDYLFALQSMEQFSSTWTKLYQYRVEINNQEVSYFCEPIPIWNNISPETARQSVDFSYSGALAVYKQLTGRNLQPKKILYRYEPPQNISEYVRIFKRRPLFNQDRNCIVFELADLQAPIVSYNPELNNIFRDLLAQDLEKEFKTENFVAQVRRTILKHYRSVFPQLEEVAAHMHLNARTLQRKLQEENTSFREVSDNIKQEMANHLLCNSNLSIADIAYKLGYAEPGTFSKAFKQWTGKTPGSYRLSDNKA